MALEPSIAQLRNFTRVAERGSFQSAAGEAFRSQPAISKSVRALERQLGGALFEPGRRTTLTPFGRACEPLAREALRQYDRSVQAMRSAARGELGSVSVAAIAAAATNWLPAIVERFLREHPQVSIRLLDDNTENVGRMVLSGKVDFGLSSLVEDPQLEYSVLMRDEFGLVCRKDHPLAGRRSLRWRELEGLRLAAVTAHRQLGDTPQRSQAAQTSLRTSNMLSLLSLLERGVAQAVLARLALPRMVPGLAFVPLVAPRRYREFGLLKVKDRSLSPAARAIVRLIEEHARHERRSSG